MPGRERERERERERDGESDGEKEISTSGYEVNNVSGRVSRSESLVTAASFRLLLEPRLVRALPR